MEFFNKNLLITIIALVTFFNTYTITTEAMMDAVEKLITSSSTSTSTSSSNWVYSFDTTAYNFTHATPTESITFQTVRYEDKIMIEAHYSNNETGEIAYAEAQLYPDNSLGNQNYLQLDSQSLSNIIDDIPNDVSNQSSIQQEHDHLNDHLHDSAVEAHRQAIAANQMTQIDAYNKPSQITKKQIRFIREKDLRKDRIYYRWDFEGVPLDSDLLLENKNIPYDPRPILSSSIIEARFERIGRNYTYKIGFGKKFKLERKFVQALESGYVLHLLNQIYDSNLPTAQAAFNELNKLWIRDRKQMFLVHNSYNKRELAFITELGIDIMGIAERALITRPDYIVERTKGQSLKTIQEYKNYCIQLQQRGNRSALRDEIKKLRSTVTKKSNFATKISLAIARKIFFDPVTILLDEIAHEPSLKKSCDHVKNLELQLLLQANQHGIISMNEVRTWITNHYGFDVLDAAQNCYKSRADYVYTPDNQSYLSDTMKSILHNIESKDLPAAHAQLVHVETQLIEGFKDQNIISPTAQQEYMVKFFGTNVLETALKKYKERSDHKEFVESFIPLDVEKSIVTILENNNTYETVADEIAHVADCVIANAKYASLDFISEIEPDIYDFIDKLKITDKAEEFIVDVSIVDHLLTDIQYTTQAIVDGKRTVWERSPELLVRGLMKFFRGLDPRTQVVNMGESLYHLGLLLKQGGERTVDALCDPITTAHEAATATFQLVKLANATSNFVSDLTFGRLYLPAKEYKKRTDFFCGMVEYSARTINENVTAEQSVDFFAQVAADLVFPWLVLKGCRLLKSIGALGKLSKPAVAVTRAFKKAASTHFTDSPVLATAEGITIKMTDAMHNINTSGGGKNIINNAKTLLESAYAKIAVELKTEITTIVEKIKIPNGFAEFAHKPIRVAYEHILGMEINLTKKGKLKLGGFHHDLKNLIEKSSAVDFSNKIFNEHGCYKSILLEKGHRIKEATFFPAHWSRKTVIEKIYQAYNNFIKTGIIPEISNDGKYIIYGLTDEGLEIEMCFTMGGEMKSAYPRSNASFTLGNLNEIR